MAQYNLRGLKEITPLPKRTARPVHTIKMATGSSKGGSPSLEAVMAAIQERKEEISRQIDAKTTSIQSSLSKIEMAMSTLADQVEEMEGHISANEDNIKDATTHIGKLEEVQSLKGKVDDLNRSRCNNIRVLGLPENAEGRDAAGFLERVLPELLGIENFSTPITCERAHRLGKPPAGGADALRPRPMIAKLLNFKNKEKIMRLARQKGEIHYGNSRVYIFPDYSPSLQRLKDAFKDVKKSLRKRGIAYSLHHPAKLRITHEGNISITFRSGGLFENY